MNIKDIARLAGVSVSTVSKVMNHKDDSISQETREKVLRTAKEYNYIPYASVITPSVKTFLIGVLFCSSTTVKRTLSGILTKARELGYGVAVSDSGGKAENELKAIAGFCKNRVDAVLWETVGEEIPPCASELEKAGIPFLIFNSSAPGSVSIDYCALGCQAARELLSREHRDIACLLNPGARTESFFEGYKKCLFDSQIPFREDFVFHSVTPSLIRRIGNHTITAVVCSHYAAAMELYARSLALHYQTPYDFSLLSLKDDVRPESVFPDISSYTIPHQQYGEFLCQKIVGILEGTGEEEDFSLHPALDSAATLGLPFPLHQKKITVVGSTNIDIYLKVPQLPSSGRTVRTARSSLYPGGKATNEAIGAAKLGQRVSLISAVGNDAESDLIYETLRDYSVDADGIKRSTDLPTGRAYIFVEPGGDSIITILSGANDILSPDVLHANEHVFENTGYALINTEVPLETVEEACRLTRLHGGKTIVKPSSCGPLPPSLLKQIDILIPNHKELWELCPGPESLEKKAALLLKEGVGTVIVTQGADGCSVFSDCLSEHFPAMDFPAIDNTGAGDAFICALASYLLCGCSLRQAVRIAGYAAGFTISREGVVPALVDKNTLEAYIQQREPKLLQSHPSQGADSLM